MSRCVSTISRPIITRVLWEEISTQYLHEISSPTKSDQIPDELILNLDQIPSKFVAASKVTMAEKGSKHVSIFFFFFFFFFFSQEGRINVA